MLPTWITRAVLTVLGAAVALWAGFALPYHLDLAIYLLVLGLILGVAVYVGDLAIALAFAAWFPFIPPIPGFRSLPFILVFFALILVLSFIRVCRTRELPYIPSFRWWALLPFGWVLIRYLLTPVYHLGASAGGKGVSGLAVYVSYFTSAAVLICFGLIITSEAKLKTFLLWTWRILFFTGLFYLIVAFTPGAYPILARFGYFVDDYGDGTTRLVILPTYGQFAVAAALCPAVFRLNRFWVVTCLILGASMVIMGGNRSSFIATLVMVPLALVAQRRVAALGFTALIYLGSSLLIFNLLQGDTRLLPSQLRVLASFDKVYSEKTGATGSAEWRYHVWESGLKKIKEAPLIGHGFGQIPQRFDPKQGLPGMDLVDDEKTDYDVVLAAGMAHNGFITAAYGFGVPFAIVMSFLVTALGLYETQTAFNCGFFDSFECQIHAFLGSYLLAGLILVYFANGLETSAYWMSLSCLCISLLRRRNSKRVVFVEPQLVVQS